MSAFSITCSECDNGREKKRVLSLFCLNSPIFYSKHNLWQHEHLAPHHATGVFETSVAKKEKIESNKFSTVRFFSFSSSNTIQIEKQQKVLQVKDRRWGRDGDLQRKRRNRYHRWQFRLVDRLDDFWRCIFCPSHFARYILVWTSMKIISPQIQ